MFRFFLIVLTLAGCVSSGAEVYEEKIAPLFRIGVIFALPESYIQDKGCPVPWFNNSRRTIEGKRTYYSGEYLGKFLVVSSLWPSKVSSAVVACNMILKYDVDLILVIGTCYSRSENSRFGDILIPNGYLNYDADVRPFFKRFEIPDLNQTVFPTDEVYKETAKRGGEAFIDAYKPEIEKLLKDNGYLKSETIMESHLLDGLVATGESFAMSRNYFLSLKKIHPDIQGFDSASGAVGQVCFEYGIPCLGINVLVPHPSESPSNEVWKTLQMQASKIYMDVLLKNILIELCSSH